MRIAIESIELPYEHDLLPFAEQRVRAALRPLEGRVKAVRVYLEDVNGPERGGVDKRCRVAVSLAPTGWRLFDDVHEDVRAALELVAARVDAWATRRAGSLSTTGMTG